MTPPPAARSNNIDAIRLLLSLTVLFSHSYPLADGNEAREPLVLATGSQLTLGSLAVSWFFVLSGYLITQSWDRSRNAWSFLIKRIARIFPAYLVAVAICLWVIIPMVSNTGWVVFSWQSVRSNLPRIIILRGIRFAPNIFMQNPFPNTINGSLWTIHYEFWCYLGVMFVGAVALLRRRWFVLPLFVASVLMAYAMERFELLPDYNPGGRWKYFTWVFGQPRAWTRLAPYFLAGMLAYLYRDFIPLRRWWALGASSTLLLGCYLPLSLKILLPTFGTYLVLYLSFTTDIRWYDVAKFGDFSYGIYLYAFPIQQLVMLSFGRSIHPLLLFTLALGPTVLAGVMSWYLVERWFLRRVRGGQISPSTQHQFDSKGPLMPG